ncbi:MAG: RNA methyltransferase [Oscillospiraceae bacterium]|nr:RNA methyltransferase [Oscillospiraceae bacterium]
MERLTSRKSAIIRHFRALGGDQSYRYEKGEYLCDGPKMLQEAIRFGAQIKTVLWKEEAFDPAGLVCEAEYTAPEDLFDYASPLKNSPGPLFSVSIRGCGKPAPLQRALVLENVQDPGNVGTVIRSANAFGIQTVILTGSCADLYHPKTVRSTMGAIFRQNVIRLDLGGLNALLRDSGLALYGAALSERAVDIRSLDLHRCAVAVGSEGRGLSGELLALCKGEVIIPMRPESESLNAAVAASVILWEMAR